MFLQKFDHPYLKYIYQSTGTWLEQYLVISTHLNYGIFFTYMNQVSDLKVYLLSKFLSEQYLSWYKLLSFIRAKTCLRWYHFLVIEHKSLLCGKNIYVQDTHCSSQNRIYPQLFQMTSTNCTHFKQLTTLILTNMLIVNKHIYMLYICM